MVVVQHGLSKRILHVTQLHHDLLCLVCASLRRTVAWNATIVMLDCCSSLHQLLMAFRLSFYSSLI